jgi:hypothetical protein
MTTSQTKKQMVPTPITAALKASAPERGTIVMADSASTANRLRRAETNDMEKTALMISNYIISVEKIPPQ